MRSSNMFVLRGRTTADIELKQAGDVSVCNFSLAVDRPYRKDKETETDFIYLTAYRHTAEFLANHVSKGTMVGVSGEIRVRTWEDQEGNKRSRVDLVVDDVEFAGPKHSRNEDSASPVKQSASRAKSAPANIHDDADDELPF